MSEQLKRIDYLDGLRGVGALQVVLLHIATMLCPSLINSYSGSSDFIKFVRNSPISFFYNGSLAVFIFFLLSGYVLASAYQNTSRPFSTLLASRFTRLFIPCVASNILCLSFMWAFVGIEGCGSVYCSSLLSAIPHFIKDITLDGMFIGYGDSSIFYHFPLTRILVSATGSSINPVLWTISIELQGSVLIVALCLLERMVRNKHWASLIALGLLVMCARSYFACFIIGYLSNRYQPATARTNGANVVSWISIALGLSLGISARDHAFPLIDVLAQLPIGLPPQSGVSFQLMIAAIFIFQAVLRLGVLHRVLVTPFFAFLGRYSFPLYLCHYPVVRYIGLYIARLPTHDLREPEQFAALAAIISIALSFGLAVLFYYPDRWGVILSRKIGNARQPVRQA